MKKNPSPVMALAHSRATFSASDAVALGISRVTLSRLVERGELSRVARGIYTSTKRQPTEFDGMLEVAAQVPSGVFCLLTALRFHRLTTQSPFEIWMAIPGKARVPNIDYPPVRVVWYSGDVLSEGIESHLIEGQSIRVYSVAKTVADCFKYRNKIGIDVAIEALQDAWKKQAVTMSELHRFAKICRVEKIIRPYLEFLV
ncbi:type IV toxin-antitoxin system AbiEi family antitoxin domain-containing protein [uncultured Massilia sp.]|uniref:type IV toxin-antitoxin system AbiEi family antitoxin domain-containing protein n=1 Tax=uncultured Massilia sp. TaxID=169973 RepID=UPI0025E84C9E|nr:type IV toxin-antitoxin system AbiEi family antitoxin domain-containing protein [uncultured Massilia sp.]